MTNVDPSLYWQKKLSGYQQERWSSLPNFFAQESSVFFPPKSILLDLGCGNGNDSLYFSKIGHQVTATDFSETGLNFAKMNTAKSKQKINFINQDLSKIFPFPNNSFDVIFSSQSLHFYDLPTTVQIFNEIYRILKPNGILAILLNNLADPEIKDYQLIEPGFYQDPNGIAKRYFSIESLKPFIKNYQILLLDENGTSFKDKAKGINNLIRFVGKKI